MPNPIQVTVPITMAGTTVYVYADTYAAYPQQVTIQQTGGQQWVATGSGEATRIGSWSTIFDQPGLPDFSVLIQYDDGSGFQNSSLVQKAMLSADTLSQIVVFSEDSDDGDDNDCLVTFIWFTPSAGAATPG